MRRSERTIALLPLGALLLFVSLYFIQSAFDQHRVRQARLTGVDELMYFPSGRLLEPVAGEYRMLIADYGWLRAIQYYAFHLVSDQNYEWLGHIIGIVTRLDPRFLGAYRFGAMVLTWDANKPAEARELLRKGMASNPLSWELPFDLGFTAYTKVKDYLQAAHYFSIAAQLPDAWSVVPRWAAVASQKAGNVDLATDIWNEILRTQDNEKLRDLARRQLRDILNMEIEALQEQVDAFVRDHKRPPEQLEELIGGYIELIPQEPFGGRFVVSRGRVSSTTQDQLEKELRALQRVVEAYRQKQGRLPQSIDDLVTAGYLPAVPHDPFGGTYQISEGRVISSSVAP